MDAFYQYVEELRELAAVSRGQELKRDFVGQVDHALDGGASTALRRLVKLEDLRKEGAFFTGSELSMRVAALFAPTLTARSVVLDPACGAGDLLLACAEVLRSGGRRGDRLKGLGRQLLGRDINESFVEAARLRLALFCVRHGSSPLARVPPSEFSGVRVGPHAVDPRVVSSATHIILNPPFTLWPAPADCGWAGGKVNSAAIFLDEVAAAARPQAQIAAILPDVLRSGSRYSRWRSRIRQRCEVIGVCLGDEFDKYTDVNVFLLHLRKRPAPAVRVPTGHPWGAPRGAGRTVGDFFRVSVGPVVDYRDPHEGPERQFICTRELLPWKEMAEVRMRRRFDGRLVDSPFVGVKRTSRPGDRFRAIAAIVNIGEAAAVENHVLVATPLDGSLKSCEALVALLKRPGTSSFLDRRIRCRHLTVDALRRVPWA